MRNFLAAASAVLGILVLLGMDNPQVSVVRTLEVAGTLLLVSVVLFNWEGIIEALFGDRRTFKVGQDAHRRPKRRDLSEPPEGLFGSHPIVFQHERGDGNSIVVAGKPYWGSSLPEEMTGPVAVRARRKADGKPLQVRRSSTDRRPIVPQR